MKRHRFIANFDLKHGSITLKDRDLVHQFSKVLMLQPKEEVVLCDGKGNESIGIIESVQKDQIHIILDKVVSEKPSTTSVTLYCALLKRENFELVAQKCTEVGVDRLVPVRTRRTIKQNLNPERLTKIIHEASEQSGRAFLPQLSPILDLEAALEDCDQNGCNIIYDVAVSESRTGAPKSGTIGIFIGPEGGWEPEEVEQARRRGLEISSLGPLVLRAEAAAIISVYLAKSKIRP